MKKKVTPKLSSNVTSDVSKNTAYFLATETKIDELQDAIKQYHEWCVEWRRLNDSLEEELQRTQFMLMDAQAVIVYLENKLGVGI